MADPKEVKPLDLTSYSAQKAGAEKGAAEKASEAPDQREAAMKAASETMRQKVAGMQGVLTMAGKPIDEPTQRYLEQYFQGAINRFDADKDNKISEKEAGEFREAMLKKTTEVVQGIAKGAEEQKKMEAAAGNTEKMDAASVKKSLEGIKDLGNIADLEQANTEIQSIQTQNEAFQQSVQAQLTSVQQFGQEYNKFQQASQGFGHFEDMWNAVFNSSERGTAVNKMKQSLEATKNGIKSLLADLTAKQKILDANGEKIKAAFVKARAEAITAREEKKAEIEKAKTEQAEQIEARKEQYKKLEEQKKQMEARRKSIEERQSRSAQVKNDWKRQEEEKKTEVQKKNCGEETKDIAAELGGYELILGNPDIPTEYKDKIRSDYEKAQARQKNNKLALEVIDMKQKSGAEFSRKLDDDQQKAAGELTTADAHLKRQQETQTSLQQNIDTLNGLQLEYATNAEEVDKYYNEKIDLLDKHTVAVDDFILNSSMSRQQSIVALEKAGTSLAGVSVESKGFWDFVNPFEAVGSLSKGYGGALHSGAQWIDKNTRDVLNMTRNSEGVFEKGIYYGTQFLSIFSGFVSGALELGGGISTLTGGLVSDIGSIPRALVSWDSKKMHFETYAGLGAIIGYDAGKGEFSFEKLGNTWGGMLKAVVGYGENWGYRKDPATGKEEWRDEYGTGLGKSVFNVLLLFVGAGAAKGTAGIGSAAKAGSTMGKAGIAGEATRIAAIDAAKLAGKSIGKFTGRGVQFAAFTKTLVTGLKPAFLTNAVRETGLTTGVVSKTAAFSKSVIDSAAKGVGQVIAKGADIIRHPLRTSSNVLKTAGKITAGIATMPYKLTWNVLKSFRNTGQAFGRVMRGVSDPRAMLAARGSERMGRAATVMEQYSDDFAKAQEALEQIIRDDPKLSARAAKIEAGGMTAEKAAQSRLALESEAAQKLAKVDPALANSYNQVRTASRELATEAESYISATRRQVENITKDPAFKASYTQYQQLQADVAAAPAGSPAAMRKARRAIKEFEKDSVQMSQARQYQEALAAQAELPRFARQVDELRDNLLGKKSGDAYLLTEELNEARAVHAPSDAPAGEMALTNNPKFAKDFIDEYQKAYAARDYGKVQELVDSLGTYREGSELAKALEGLHQRQRLGISAEPPVAAGFKNKFRGDMMKSLDEALRTGDYRAYEAVKGRLYGRNTGLDAYIDWMEDVYKKHPQEASAIIVADNASFSSALKANQGESLRVFDDFSKKISEGITPDKLRTEMQAANLDATWQSALEQMRERLTIRNRQTALTADIALNRIRGEYAEIINPEMTAAEAAKRLEQRYRNDSMGQVGSARPGDKVVAKDIKLKDGIYDLRVENNGTVRLYDKAGEMVVPDLLSARIAEGIQQRLGKPKVAPAAAPATAPASTPAPATAPSQAPAPAASREYRRFETREAKVQSAIKKDPALQALEGRGELGHQIARGKAEVQIYRSELRASRVEAELQGLESKLHEAKTANVATEISAAEQSLNTFKNRADYLEYQRFQQADNVLRSAEQAMGNDLATMQHLREAQKALVTDSVMKRLDRSALTAEEAANLLNRETIPATTPAGGTAAPRPALGAAEELGEITLKGNKQYKVRLTETGEFRLFETQTGNPILTSTERALQPIPFEQAGLTMDSLAAQPKNTTVAYGTGSAKGDWVEVTKLENGKHRVVTVENGKVTSIMDDVENLRIADDAANAGRQRFTWDRQGKAGEYGNIQEVFKPAKYETINPAPITAPAVAPATITPHAPPSSAAAKGGPYRTQATTPSTPPAATNAAPASAPTPTTAAATPAERMKQAIETRRQARTDIRSGRQKIINLEESIPRLEQRIEAMKIRNVSDIQIRAAEQNLANMQAERAALNIAVEEAAGKIWGTRTDYWKARVVEKGQAIRDFVGVTRRIDWLKSKVKIIGTAAEKGVKVLKVLKVPADLLWEALQKQVTITASTGPKLFLLGQTGHAIANQLDALHEAAKNRFPAVTVALHDVAMDQYRILAEIQKGSTQSLGLPGEQAFAAMTPEQQTEALRGGYSRLEGAESISAEGLVYTEPQKDYIEEKRQIAGDALSSLNDRNPITLDEVTGALDEAFGPQGLNDAQVGYEIEVQGVKIKVDRDGQRTYEGLENWVAAAPARQAFGETGTEVPPARVAHAPHTASPRPTYQSAETGLPSTDETATDEAEYTPWDPDNPYA